MREAERNQPLLRDIPNCRLTAALGLKVTNPFYPYCSFLNTLRLRQSESPHPPFSTPQSRFPGLAITPVGAVIPCVVSSPSQYLSATASSFPAALKQRTVPHIGRLLTQAIVSPTPAVVSPTPVVVSPTPAVREGSHFAREHDFSPVRRMCGAQGQDVRPDLAQNLPDPACHNKQTA